MATSKFKFKTTLQLLGVAAFLFLFASGFFILGSLGKSQDNRQQAWIGKNDVGDTVAKEKCLNGDCNKNSEANSVFVSDKGIYTIDLTETGWQEAELPNNLSSKNNDPSFFVYRSDFGFATIFLNAVSTKNYDAGLNIQSLANILEKQITTNLDSSVSYLGKEITLIANKQVIRYKFKEKLLGNEAFYDEYVMLGKNNYIEAEVRSMNTPVSEKKVKAFLNSLKFVSQAGNVKGVSTEKSSKVSLNESEITQLVKPSVASILHVYCKEIRTSNTNTLKYLKPSYSFCGGATGSGFVVNQTGLVATNGHVVKSYPEQDLIMGIANGKKEMIQFLVNLVQEIYYAQTGEETTEQQGYTMTAMVMQDPVAGQALMKSIFKLISTGDIKVVPVKDKYYVNLGFESFEFLNKFPNVANIDNFIKQKDSIFDADLSAVDFANLYSKEVVIDKKDPKGSDVALLKISNPKKYSFPSLKLGNVESIKEGDSVLILGFPGVVSGSQSELSLIDYNSSSGKVTVTRGIVSSIKKDFGGNSLIQTDATIGHGNSGGPAFNSHGEVIGLATYGMGDEAGNFNFLRDIADLEQLADKNKASVGVIDGTYKNWETALNLYWANRYSKSLKFLNAVEKSYPIHPTVAQVAQSAKVAIDEGKDIDMIYGMQKTLFYQLVGALVFALLLITTTIVILVVKKKKNKKALESVASSTNQQNQANTPFTPSQQGQVNVPNVNMPTGEQNVLPPTNNDQNTY